MNKFIKIVLSASLACASSVAVAGVLTSLIGAVPAGVGTAERCESSATISLGVLGALVDNDPEIMSRLLHIFIDNAELTVAEFNVALAARDLATVNALGHRFKSSARAIGAGPLAEICSLLETLPSIDSACVLVPLIGPQLDLVRLAVANNARFQNFSPVVCAD